MDRTSSRPRPSSADHELAGDQDAAFRTLVDEALHAVRRDHSVTTDSFTIDLTTGDGLFHNSARDAVPAALEIVHLALRRIASASDGGALRAKAILAEELLAITLPSVGVVAMAGNLARPLTPIEAGLAGALAAGQSITIVLATDDRASGHEHIASALFLEQLALPSPVELLRDLGRCGDARLLLVEHMGAIVTLTDLDYEEEVSHAFAVEPAATRLELPPVHLTDKQARALKLAREHLLVTPGQAMPGFLEKNPDAWVIEPAVIAGLRRRGLVHRISATDGFGFPSGPDLYVATGSARSETFLRRKLSQA